MAKMFDLVTKNFFAKKPTRLFPVAPERIAFHRSRGRIVFDEKTCILCSICARRCPADAITVNRATGKWELDAFRCIICGECVVVCPKKSITMSNERRHGSETQVIETFMMEPPKPPAPKQPVTKPAATTETTPAPVSQKQS
ncbi:MAG: 4Fe-4S dicluster domain-containing protein [Clostridiaceae bacterium]|nr:4Fe-4S dicluster domain-containing protein [Clostridiaceae bacterium]